MKHRVTNFIASFTWFGTVGFIASQKIKIVLRYSGDMEKSAKLPETLGRSSVCAQLGSPPFLTNYVKFAPINALLKQFNKTIWNTHRFKARVREHPSADMFNLRLYSKCNTLETLAVIKATITKFNHTIWNTHRLKARIRECKSIDTFKPRRCIKWTTSKTLTFIEASLTKLNKTIWNTHRLKSRTKECTRTYTLKLRWCTKGNTSKSSA